jgi:NADPH:quinone reductase-like Zn-dependent oxidoreductase
MKAVFFQKHGGPEVLQYGCLPDPVPRPGEVLIDVCAASLNGADWKVRSGISGRVADVPHVLGRDFSGVVCGLGEGVADLKVGDEVFAVCDSASEGAYAEKIAIDSSIVAKKPAALSHTESAAVALVSLTALCAIVDTLELKPGEWILIHGGAGGVAGMAIQLAKHVGARVATTASARNIDYLLRLGADKVIDYQAQDFTKAIRDFDAVLDTVGGQVAERSFQVLRAGGRAAFLASGRSAPISPRPDVASLRPKVVRSKANMERVAVLVAGNVLRVPELQIFDLSEAARAHEISEARHVRGKLVFKVR